MTSLADQLRQLLPPVSYDGSARILSAIIEAEAGSLTASESNSTGVYRAMFPDTGEALSDWERVLGLPDPCLLGHPKPLRNAYRQFLASSSPGAGKVALSSSSWRRAWVTT